MIKSFACHLSVAIKSSSVINFTYVTYIMQLLLKKTAFLVQNNKLIKLLSIFSPLNPIKMTERKIKLSMGVKSITLRL